MIPYLVIILLLGLFLPQVDVLAQLALPDKKAVAFYTDAPPQIDGRVDGIWLNASVQEGFVQREPYQREKASQDTRFYVLYDLDHIYFLFVMLDNEPEDIPSRLLERDQQFYPDDNINFYLDTYNDQRKAFFFATNPAGVEKDGLISENGDNLDLTWDAIFHVAARRNNYGWVAEFAIPFTSIRFTDDLKYQIWGFNVWRTRKKNREISYWSPVDQNFQMYRLDKGGVLIGMQNIHSGQNLNMLPYFTTRHITEPENKETDLNLGIDVKYGITSDITIDLTVNPDFGQVEIDAEQINLDKRYEIQLEEKRPFFLENTNLFQTPYYQMFYSRRIGALSDIKTGAKITGKLGSYSIGALGAFTGGWENYGLGDPSDPDPVDELFSVLRVQRDILTSSNVGLMYVDRATNLGGKDREYNKAGGLDVNLHSGQFYFIGQGVYSYNYDKAKVMEGASGFAEAGYYDQLFRLDVYNLYYSRDFDLEKIGYFPKVPEKGHYRNGLYSDIHPLINRKYVRSWGLSLEPFYFKDSDESTYSAALQSKAWLEFADQTMLKVGYTRYRDVEADNYYYYFRTPLKKGDELVYWGRDIFAELTTDIGKPISLIIRWNYDSQYYFQTHTTGFNRGIESYLLLKPVSNAFLELGFQNRKFLDSDDQYMPSELVGQSNVQIWSLRSRYLFSKNIFSRIFFQHTNGAEEFVYNDSIGFYQYQLWKRMSANVLLGWRFKAGSTIYLAYTEEWDRRRTEDRYKSANRILFFKFSYLWSL
jgi:hypothetical protein